MADKAVDYEALADALAVAATTPSERALRAAEAAAAGRELLRREYGSDEAIARAIRPGRPRLDEPARGASPTVRARISEADYAAVRRLEAETGKSQSELVREAIRLLLERGSRAS